MRMDGKVEIWRQMIELYKLEVKARFGAKVPPNLNM